ncbi:helix-turn-helix domain-containing protein [Nocardioides sp. NPDC057577]|uniref:helix-turn-helix domain-containing protein n=1 Tax=Nocardioides sp. NPDC057577 TaxID=3346171 RepID=UPI003672146B
MPAALSGKSRVPVVNDVKAVCTSPRREKVLVQRSCRVLDRPFIRAEMRGYEFLTIGNALDDHARYFRSRTGGESEPRLIHTTHRIGYVVKEP